MSYAAFREELISTSYASDMILNCASSGLEGFLSGWYLNAN
jgi:hypothetical protein